MAVKKVVDFANKAWERNCPSGIIMLDVKNAFNTAPWDGILEALKKKGVSPYLLRILQNYFTDRSIMVDGVEIPTSCGVPQGSCLSPFLWLVYYDFVVGGALPQYSLLTAFADDVAVSAWEKTIWSLIWKLQRAVTYTIERIWKLNLQTAIEKTVFLILRSKKADRRVTIKIDNEVIRPERHGKYLGVWLSTGLHFREHLRITCAKVKRVVANLTRIMPNKGGPSAKKRRIIASVAISILSYAAPVWADIVKTETYSSMVRKTFRPIKIKITRAYRTTSDEALDVLARIPPIDLLLLEHKARFDTKDPKLARTEMMESWEDRWCTDTGKAEWTKRLIPDLNLWLSNNFAEVNFETVQLLTGHGSFMNYLHRFRIKDSDKCSHCNQEDTAEHVIFTCNRWKAERDDLGKVIGAIPPPEELIEILLSEKKFWKAFEKFANRVMTCKRKELSA